MTKHDEYGWDRVEKKKEPDPDLQYLKLRAKQARPARYALYALVVVGILILYMLMNPIQQSIQAPTVDFNPAGKQAAWKLTDSWLTDGKPLGTNPSIISWDGSEEHSFSGQKGLVTGVDHQFTVRTDLGWWTVDTVVKKHGGGLIGSPSVKRRAGLPKSATNGDTNTEWAGTLDHMEVSEALDRLCVQWGQALAGSDADLLTTLMKDPDPNAVYTPLRLGGVDLVQTGIAAYLKRGTIDKDENTSDRGVVRVTLTLKSREENSSAASTVAYDVLVADPDAQPRILAWGAPGSGPDLKEYSNAR